MRICLLILVAVAVVPQNLLGQQTVFTFDGPIEGSELIELDPNQATWNNLYWGPPPSVTVNGNSWSPAVEATLPLDGPLFPDDLSDYYVRMTQQSGRDTVAAGIESDRIQIYLADTPNGSDHYSFQVELVPRGPRPTTPLTELRLRVPVDGSDRIRISSSAMQLFHGFWESPAEIDVNGFTWNAPAQSMLPNSGSSQYLPDYIDFRSATLVRHEGRDLSAVAVNDNYVDLLLADNPLGGGYYDVSIFFGHYLPGDANGDGVVDGADYTSWADHFDAGLGQAEVSWRDGDWNGDGHVDGADYTLWADHFAPVLDASLTTSAVPEPSALALAGLGCAVLAFGFTLRRAAD